MVYAQNHPTISDAMAHTNNQSVAFKSYDIFQSSTIPLSADLKTIATDVESVDVNASVLSDIQEDQPDFIQFSIAHAAETYTIKLQRVNLFADDFQLRNQNDEILDYNRGLYYRGKIAGHQESVAVFNFFSESLNGIISERNKGNIIIGQLKDSDTYVVYSDQSMTVNQDFTCEVNDIEQMQEIPSQNQMLTNSNQTSKCVRVFYELTNDIYQNNNSSVSDTMNWMSSVHNIVATLYSDQNIPTVLSDVLIWQQLDPYTGEN
ncbi:MAG: zinc metalloprotease, partial [Psychroflexus sp.]|nr:zinc metalloprotease [Psychroflexus sp.]